MVKIDDEVYYCDPSKHTKCTKTGCFLNGGTCRFTLHEEYADTTIDVAPVRHGRWILNRQYGPECSECGTAMFEIVGSPYTTFEPNYCPNCGADMRGESDATN